jgi:hypothetical protein
MHHCQRIQKNILLGMALYNAYGVYTYITQEKMHVTDFGVDIGESMPQNITFPEHRISGRPPLTVP